MPRVQLGSSTARKVDEERVNRHCLDEGWKVEGGSRPPDYSSGMCGSGVSSTSVDNGCINVAYHLKACNTLGVCVRTARLTYGFTVPAARDVDGYGSKDACWRADFRAGANANGNSYNEAQQVNHISSWDEAVLCGSGAAYTWSLVTSYGTKCKYRP